MAEQSTLSRMKISRQVESLFFVPRKIKDYTRSARLVRDLRVSSGQNDNIPQMATLSVVRKEYQNDAGRPVDNPKVARRLLVTLSDPTGAEAKAYVFGNVWPWSRIIPGDTVSLHGPVKQIGRHISFSNPEIVPDAMHGKIYPVYPKVRGGSASDTIASVISESLPMARDAIALMTAEFGVSSREIAAESGFDSLESFFRSLHAPVSVAQWKKAMSAVRRLAVMEIREKANRTRTRGTDKRSVLLVDDSDIAVDGLDLTEDQIEAARHILTDLRSSYPMRRLLSGDVGCGKTLPFIAAASRAQAAGAKTAIFAPNEPLVLQIASELQQYFPGTPFQVVTSGRKSSMESGNPVLIGTSALIGFCLKNEWVGDFIVIDEQHKLSRDQRESICGSHTNILESTATAIPRSLALVTHGGMDVSVLRQMPVRKEIESRIIHQDERGDLFRNVREVISEGGQVAIVYPMVDQDQESTLSSVEDAFSRWESAFPGRVVKAHGQMKPELKNLSIDAMKKGSADILVCSSVIEVGLTIPALRAVVVVNPERYGVAQLHQMRGRVARLGGKGYFWMFTPDPIQEFSMERLKQVEAIQDGFALSEMDMRTRGFGDLDEDSDEQTGESQFLFRGIKITVGELMDSLNPSSSGPGPSRRSAFSR